MPRAPVDLAVGVISARHHFAERAVVRATWAGHSLHPANRFAALWLLLLSCAAPMFVVSVSCLLPRRLLFVCPKKVLVNTR